MNTLAYIAFAVVFLVCTVVLLGFVLVASLGWTAGLFGMAFATPFVLFILWRLYTGAFAGQSLGGGGHKRPR